EAQIGALCRAGGASWGLWGVLGGTRGWPSAGLRASAVRLLESPPRHALGRAWPSQLPHRIPWLGSRTIVHFSDRCQATHCKPMASILQARCPTLTRHASRHELSATGSAAPGALPTAT